MEGIVNRRNKTTLDSFLEKNVIESRDYQENIAARCVNQNSLVVIPTGLGKTIIGVLVATKTMELYPSSSKIIMMAPTRPLINQHYESFLKFIKVPEERFVVLTGKITPDKRAKLFRENQVIFFTPQTLRNDLVNRRYTLEDTCLIIFDEAHHASGDYPYTLIADEYLDQNPDGNILALTASPGSSKEKIAQLCLNLHVPLENIHIRTRKDSDVKQYVKPMDIYKIGVNLTGFMEEIYGAIKRLLEQRLQYLSQMGHLDAKGDDLVDRVIRKDLLKLNMMLINIINGSGNKTGAYSAMSINAQALILFHMIILIEQQGLDVLLMYLEKINKDSRKKSSSKAVKVLVGEAILRGVYTELKKNEEFSPENLIHPKYNVLKKVLKEELSHEPNSRILVFVKLRDSVRNIVDRLKEVPKMKPVRFVGQATKSAKDKGLSQKRQIEILEKFKEGVHNVLVSTNVGEEGLDIAECDLVVFYDVVASEIRLIQRKGRTARHREGKVIILYCKDTSDEKYMQIALQKLRKMKVNLKDPSQLREFYEKNQLELKEERDGLNRQQDLVEHVMEIEKNKMEKRLDVMPDVKLSKNLPVKFGLRQKLSTDDISFQMTEGKDRISLFDEVLIVIHSPSEFSKRFGDDLVSRVMHWQESFSLVLNVFDFIDREEKFEGEKRFLKGKIREFGKKHGIKVFNADNSEELYFMIKSVHDQKGGSK